MNNQHIDNIASYARSILAEVPLAQVDFDILQLPDMQANPTQAAQQWQQIKDSPGQHQPAVLSWTPSDRMYVNWTPTVRPSGQDWDNQYMWRVVPVRPRDKMIYDLGIKFAAKDGLNVPEHELHMVRDQKIYNTGVQYGKTVRVFDFSKKAWQDTGIPVLPDDFTTSMETRLVVLCSLLPNSICFDTISINGRMVTIGMEFPTVATTGPDHINVSWQLDGNNKALPIAASYRADVFGI